MTEWRSLTLADLASVQTGPFGSQLHASDYLPDGVPVVMPQDLGSNLISTAQVARVSEEDAERLHRHRLSLGDIVFSRRGDVTRRALIRTENIGWLCGTGCLRVQPNANVDPAFLSFAVWTLDAREWLVAHAVGATMPNLNTTILGRLPLVVPPFPEQQAIAEVLGALDDKIAANTRLAATVWDLLEAEFRRIQLDEHALRTTLSEIASLEYGKSLPAVSREPGSASVVGSGGLSGTHSTALVERSGVVVGRKGSAGSVHWVFGPHFPIDTTFFVKGSAEGVSQPYLYFLLRTLRLNEMNNDSAVPGLNRAEALALPVHLPSRELLAAFEESASTLINTVELVVSENRTLVATRDALLPKLMSGKLRVRDIERLGESVDE